jgi:hypothetical protein
MIEKPTRGSPVDSILIAASIIFPLDFVLLALIVNPPPPFAKNLSCHLHSISDFVFTFVLFSRFGILGCALRLYPAVCCQKARHPASGPAIALYVSVVARFCNAVANRIPCATGT